MIIRIIVTILPAVHNDRTGFFKLFAEHQVTELQERRARLRHIFVTPRRVLELSHRSRLGTL